MRWALAWALYWTGDLVQRWNDNDARFTERGFNLYQWLMRASDTAQGTSGRGPWSVAARDSDGSGEAGETGETETGLTEGDSP